MSRQNKQVQKAKLATQFSQLHKRDEKGPAKTNSPHGKTLANKHYTTKTRGLKDMANSRKRNAA